MGAITSARESTYGRAAAIGIGFLALYVLLDWISYVEPVLRFGITPWNPQTGLALAFLIVFGPNRAVWVAAAALAAELLERGDSVSLATLSFACVAVAVGYAVAAAALRRLGLGAPIRSPAAAAWLVGVGALAAAAVAAVYALGFAYVGTLPRTQVGPAIMRFWVGDLNGILTVTPLLLMVHEAPRLVRAVREFPGTVVSQACALVAAFLLIFGVIVQQELRFFYPLFVPVLWITLRWGLPGALLAVLFVQIGLVIAVESRLDATPFVALQFFTATLGTTAIVFGAVVTEREDAQARVRERDAALARAMRFAVAGELASAATHELNQPIGAMGAYLRAAAILAEPLIDREPRLQEVLDKAARESRRASEVIQRLRDFYRAAGARPEPLDVEVACARAIAAFEGGASRKGVALSLDVPSALPRITTDATHLEIVVHNLIANALDALDDGSARERRVVLSATIEGEEARIAVDDSGPGISPDMAARIFEPFYTSKPDGMGLGLSISQTLMRNQGGDLHVEPSALGGARFVMRLPLRPASEAMA